MTHPPVVDRSEGRAAIRAQLDRQARENGHADHVAAADADYAAWRVRAQGDATK